MKYFYYISKSKVDMLLPQFKRKKFSLPSISPKIGYGGISIGADIKKENAPELVTQTLDLIALLKKNHRMKALSGDKLQTSILYQSNAIWYHGLFYFQAGEPTDWQGEKRVFVTAVVYIAWMPHRDSLILLVGSPNHVLGNNVARDGVFVPGTSGAVEEVEHIVKRICSDESALICHSKYDNKEPKLPENITLDAEPFIFNWGDDKFGLPGMRSVRYPLSLSIFCFKYLGKLPQSNIDTLFKVYSVHESSTDNFYQDLCRNYECSGKALQDQDRNAWESSFAEAERIELHKYNRVYIGSPIYTALE